VSYSSEQVASNAIARFDNKAIEGLICRARPYFEEGGMQRTGSDKSLMARRVYLMNMPYDASIKEIEALVKEFAEVDKVVVPRDKAGLARGFAFVFLKKAEDVEKVIDYVDGRHLRDRQIRVKKSLGAEHSKSD